MPQEKLKKIHPTIRITSTLLIIYGAVTILYTTYSFFAMGILGSTWGILVSIFDESEMLSTIIGLIWAAIYLLMIISFLMIILLALMLFNAAKQLIDGKKAGASMGIGGILVLAVPGFWAMLEYVYVKDDLILIPVAWLIYNIVLLSFLRKSNKMLSK